MVPDLSLDLNPGAANLGRRVAEDQGVAEMRRAAAAEDREANAVASAGHVHAMTDAANLARAVAGADHAVAENHDRAVAGARAVRNGVADRDHEGAGVEAWTWERR